MNVWWCYTMKNNLRNLREQKRYTLRELSEKTGVNYASLSRLENLNQDFTGEQLKTFADFFKVSIDYLLAREPIPHPTTIVKNIDLNYQSIKEYMFRAPKEELIKIAGLIDGLLQNGSSTIHNADNKLEPTTIFTAPKR